MPVSPEALLLSSILRDRDFNDALAAGVKDEMFRGYKDEWLWLSRYYNKHKRTPSKVAFTNQFPDFKIKMVNDTPHFADQVREAYAKHRLSQSVKEMASLMAEGDLTSALATIQTEAVHIGASLSNLRDSDFLSDWEDTYNEVQGRKERYEKYGMAGIPTGFPSFDERTGGLTPGQITIVAARLGQKKSWTLQRMAVSCLMGGFSAHYSSLEMSKAEVNMRLHNMLSGRIGQTVFRATDLMQGRDFDIHAYRAFLRDLRNTVQGQMTVSDTRNIGLAEIEAQLEKYKPDVYFLDYLTLARIGGDGGWKAIGDFTKGLKDMAKEREVAVVAAAQLNRLAITGGKPGPENIGGSDQIGQDADNVIMLKQRSKRITEFFVPKLRGGADQFGWMAEMDMDRGVFDEVTYEEALDIIEKDKSAADLASSKIKSPPPLKVVGGSRPAKKRIRRA